MYQYVRKECCIAYGSSLPSYPFPSDENALLYIYKWEVVLINETMMVISYAWSILRTCVTCLNSLEGFCLSCNWGMQNLMLKRVLD